MDSPAQPDLLAVYPIPLLLQMLGMSYQGLVVVVFLISILVKHVYKNVNQDIF